MSDRVNSEITERFAEDNEKCQVKYTFFIFMNAKKNNSFRSKLPVLEIYFCHLTDGCRSLAKYVLLTNVVCISTKQVAKKMARERSLPCSYHQSNYHTSNRSSKILWTTLRSQVKLEKTHRQKQKKHRL